MPFQPGISGNLNGRPKGAGSRQQVFNALVEPHKEALFQKAIDLALDGNEAMLRLFLDRMLPAKPTDEPIQIAMPAGDFSSTETINQLGSETMRAVTAGEITPEEASRIATLLKAHQDTYQLVELRDSFRLVQENIEGGNKSTEPPYFNNT
jgi:hypothetical protein